MKLKLLLLIIYTFIYLNLNSAQVLISRPDVSHANDNSKRIIAKLMTLMKEGFDIQNPEFVAVAIYQIRCLTNSNHLKFAILACYPNKEFVNQVKEIIKYLTELHKNQPINYDQFAFKPKKVNKHKKKKKLDPKLQKELDARLFKACSSGQNDLIEKLIEIGANIEAKRVDGRTPFHVAISAFNFTGVKLMIKYGANVNTETNLGITALHILAQQSFDDNNDERCAINEAMAYLILTYTSQNTLLKTTKRNGWNAAHVAAAYGNLKVLRLLIKSGLHPKLLTRKIPGKVQMNAIEIAQIYNQNHIVEYLQKLNN